MRLNHAALIGFALGVTSAVLMYEIRPNVVHQNAVIGISEGAESRDEQNNSSATNIGDPA